LTRIYLQSRHRAVSENASAHGNRSASFRLTTIVYAVKPSKEAFRTPAFFHRQCHASKVTPALAPSPSSMQARKPHCADVAMSIPTRLPAPLAHNSPHVRDTPRLHPGAKLTLDAASGPFRPKRRSRYSTSGRRRFHFPACRRQTPAHCLHAGIATATLDLTIPHAAALISLCAC